MEQKALNNISENSSTEKNSNMSGLKIWITPELRTLPVPSNTQFGNTINNVNETNGIYRKS